MTPATAKALTLKVIPSPYGDLTLDDPAVVDLIESAPFQRLKEINQYGVVNYITPTEKYTRYDHSIGVYYLLKEANVSREEQIAGLLHDVSHTVFSHVGDYVFHDQYPGSSYQDDIHIWYLKESGLENILKFHKLSSEQVYHKREGFTALDQKLPRLCADRIEYNLQGGFLRGLMTQNQFEVIAKELKYADGDWSLATLESARILGNCSLVMTETLWGASWEALAYRWTAEALRRAFEIHLITFNEFHFSTDDLVWNKLKNTSDPQISELMWKITHVYDIHELVDPGQEDIFLRLKFRGINPIIRTELGLFPLSHLDPSYKQNFEKVKATMDRGWFIKFKQ